MSTPGRIRSELIRKLWQLYFLATAGPRRFSRHTARSFRESSCVHVRANLGLACERATELPGLNLPNVSRF